MSALMLRTQGLFELAAEELKDNERFVLQAVRLQGPSVIQDASQRLRIDREFILKAMAVNRSCLDYTGEELKSDKELLSHLIDKAL